MRCPGCGAENRDARRFCGACGAPLAAACAGCGFVNEADEKFCGGCGRALERAPPPVASAPPPAPPPAAPGERRQVTVLFCDLAGYTELTRALGAETVHALTDRFFELADGAIERFGGHVDKHIGDCVMAVFGAPVAHGNDPERAVRAALAIRDAMPALEQEIGRRLGIHVGIASGQVVASGGAGHRTYSITGDSVNLASRLTDHAETGTILISEAVRVLLGERLDCVDVGLLPIKGLSQPVRAYRLRGLQEQARASARAFVGRRAELLQIVGALEACRATGSGQTVYLRGEAGIGKTRLLEECQRRAEALGFRVHVGLVLDFGTASGHDAIRTLTRGLLGLQPGSPAPAVAAAAETAGAADGQAHERRVHLNDLLDLPQPLELRALYDAMDNGARNRGKQETVAELVSWASRAAPRLLLVEDLHWADRPTLEYLARLTQTVAGCPALLVMTSRIEGDPLDPLWRSRVAGSPLLTIDLGPLREDEANALATAYYDASTAFARRCVQRAAGNPLFLEQLLRHAEDSAEGTVPGSVQSLVQARLDHLPAPDRQALQAASVLGQKFSAEALGHLLGVQRYDPDTLIRHFLVRPVGDELLFAHALIRDGVYDSLLRATRLALHRSAAAWFVSRDAVLHAEHLDRGEDPGAPRAYLAAARAEAAAYHQERALALVGRGLDLAALPDDRFELTCLRGEILHDLGQMAPAGEAFAAALAAAADDGARCRARIGRAAVRRVIDDLDGAFADLAEAEQLARTLDLREQLARIHGLRGNLHFPRGEIAACLEQHERSRELAQAAGSAEIEAAALGGLGDAEYCRGRMLSARDRFERCIALCRRHGFGRIEVASLPMAAIARFYAGEVAEAYADALAAVAAAERVGHRRAATIGCHIVFLAAMSRGELEVARRYVDKAIELARQLGARRFEAEGLWFLGEVRLVEGRREEAVALVREGLAISRATGMAYLGPAILGGLARITTDDEERRAALAEGERLLAAGSISHNHFWFYQAAIDSALERGEWQEAERCADALAAYTSGEPLPYLDGFVARGKALAAFGRGRRDRALRDALQGARAQAEALGWRSGLPALDRSLAALAAAVDA